MTHRWTRAPTLGAVHLLCGSLIILCLTNTCRCDVPVCKTRTNLLLPPPSLQPHAIAVSSKRSRLELNVSKIFPSPIHLSVERCLVPHAIIPSPVPSTVLGTPNAQKIYSHFVVRVGVVSSHLARSQVHVDVILKLRSPNSFQSTLYSTKLCIPYHMEVAIGNHYDTFLFPLTPDWVIDDTEIMVHKLSPRTTYSFYAALHQVPAITDAERNRSPNLLDSYFLALGQPGASEDPKRALQDLLDLNTMHFSSVELITDAAGKRHFQFETLGDDITTQMTFTRQHFPSTLSPTFTFALDVQLVIPQGSVKSFGCDICAMLSHQLHSRMNAPEEHCLYITALHIEQHRLKHQPDADENHLYPVLITAPWTNRMMKLRDIDITFKCRVSTALSSFRIRPIGAYLINDSYPSPHASLMTTHSASAPPISSKSLEPPIADLTSTTLDNTVIKSPLHFIVTPASVDPLLSAPGTQEHALGAPSFPDTTPGEVSPSGGETVPTPDPHDTRDPTVSPVQPRSRGMGSLRAVVGALGAGRRSTSVVAAAVVRRGMPRPGRAGAWGTGRAALLVLGVVCGVALLLAAVVLVLVRMRRNSKNQIEPVSPSDGSNSLRKAFLDNKRSEVMNVNSERSIICMVDVG